VFDGLEHQSVLRYPGLRDRAFVIFSFGKTYHATGWKLGYCFARENLMREFRKVHQFVVFSSNTPLQYALADYLDDRDEYMKLPRYYQLKRDYFLRALKRSRFRFTPSEGTYFQLLDYSAITDEGDVKFAERLTKEHGIASIPVSVFYSQKTDHRVLRFCFAKSNTTLKKAAQILCKL
jgi:methionine aminotransferase